MRQTVPLIGIVVILMTLAACEIETTSDPLTIPLILGKYVPKKVIEESEYVELSADSTYTYYRRDGSGNVHIYRGEYSLIFLNDDPCKCHLEFEDFVRSPLMKYDCTLTGVDSPEIRKRFVSYSVLLKKFDDSVFFYLCENGDRDLLFVKHLDEVKSK